MSLTRFRHPLVRQAVVILEGDELVIPEVVRAINSGIKNRYKVIDVETVLDSVCTIDSILDSRISYLSNQFYSF